MDLEGEHESTDTACGLRFATCSCIGQVPLDCWSTPSLSYSSSGSLIPNAIVVITHSLTHSLSTSTPPRCLSGSISLVTYFNLSHLVRLPFSQHWRINDASPPSSSVVFYSSKRQTRIALHQFQHPLDLVNLARTHAQPLVPIDAETLPTAITR